MTDATTPAPSPPASLAMLGEPGAAACEGEACVIPEHAEQAIVVRRLDADVV